MPARRIRTVFNGVPGTPWYSNMFFDTDVAVSAQDAMDAVVAFWNTVDASMVSTVSWFTESEVPLFTNPGTIAGWETATSGSGNGVKTAGLALPWQTQALVRWQTGAVFNNRRVLGHTYIPGLSEDDNAGGLPTATLLNTVDAAAEAVVEAGLVIGSRVANVFYPTTGSQLSSQWSVLRSRRD